MICWDEKFCEKKFYYKVTFESKKKLVGSHLITSDDPATKAIVGENFMSFKCHGGKKAIVIELKDAAGVTKAVGEYKKKSSSDIIDEPKDRLLLSV